MIETDIRELNEKIQRESQFVDLIYLEMNKVIIGQKHMTERLLIGLLANGHILLEGVPGWLKHWPLIRWQMWWMPNSAAYNLLPTCCLPTCWEH